MQCRPITRLESPGRLVSVRPASITRVWTGNARTEESQSLTGNTAQKTTVKHHAGTLYRHLPYQCVPPYRKEHIGHQVKQGRGIYGELHLLHILGGGHQVHHRDRPVDCDKRTGNHEFHRLLPGHVVLRLDFEKERKICKLRIYGFYK